MTCPTCGASTPDGARFCPACGTELAAAPRSEASGPTPISREERKIVSVIFIDQVGSTARADGADPEDVRDQQRLYFDVVRDAIERHGGTIEKYAGDAVMAVFGAPLAREDDAERALDTAFSVLARLEELNAGTPGLDLVVRIGVNTGEAIVDVDPAPESALATGDAVNTAARLEAAAPPGRVVVGAETYRLTKHEFAFESLPPISAKGKRDPVPAWLAIGRLEASRAVAPRSQIIGRDLELQIIRAVWRRAVMAREPHLISIIGPAGIGKSRLADEVAAEAARDGARILRGRSVPYGQRSPYHAAGQLVRGASGIFDNDPVEIAREKLAAFVGSLIPDEEASASTRYLSLLMGLGLDVPTDKASFLHYALRNVLESLAAETPLLVVLDDMQWADESLVELTRYLAVQLHDRPLVIMALARPDLLDAHPTWGAGITAHTSVNLSPLAPDEAAAVVRALLAERPGAVDRIVETAGGNPLFIEELVASMEHETAEQLPGTVRAVIAGRIDALPSAARDALLRASVMGATFWRGVLEEIVETGNVDDALATLEARGFVQRHPASRVTGETEYVFKHDLTREAAYATLPKASRRALHAATARVLERSAPDPTEVAWILAHHWREAGDAQRALEYLLTAADRAADAVALDETYDLYTKALELAGDDDQRRKILLARGLALARLQDYPRAVRELGELLPELSGVDEVEALLARASSTLWTEQTDETIAGATRALERARAQGVEDLEAVAIGMLGAGHGMRGEPGDLERAISLGEQAVSEWVPGRHRRQLAEVAHLQSDHYYWAGRYERSLEMARMAREAAGAEPGTVEFLLRGAGMEGLALSALGRYEEAIAITDQSISIAISLGRPTSVVTNYSTLPLREIFAVDEAKRRSEDVANDLGPSEFNMPWMNARADALQALVLAGDLARASKTWPSMWDDSLASKAWERWLIGGRLVALRAEIELGMGNVEEAITWALRATEVASSTMRRKYEAISRTLLGRSLMAGGAADDAATGLRSSIDLADELGSPLLRWQARTGLAAALRASRSRDDADAIANEARDIIRGVAASLTPEHAAGYLAAPAVVEALNGS